MLKNINDEASNDEASISNRTIPNYDLILGGFDYA